MEDEKHRAALVALYASDSDSPSDIELLNYNPLGLGLPKSNRPASGTSASSGTTVRTTSSSKCKVAKPKVAKKKKKPKKNTLKKFYPVNYNFQGINEKKCRHVPAESRGKVFMPVDYGPPPLSKKLFTDYCAECCLQPCCMEEFSSKILSEGMRLRSFERYPNSTIRDTLKGYIHQWLKPVFPAPYWKRLKKATPSCVIAKLLADHPDGKKHDSRCLSETDESSDEEEEFVL